MSHDQEPWLEYAAVRFGYGRVTVNSGYSLLFEMVGEGECRARPACVSLGRWAPAVHAVPTSFGGAMAASTARARALPVPPAACLLRGHWCLDL